MRRLSQQFRRPRGRTADASPRSTPSGLARTGRPIRRRSTIAALAAVAALGACASGSGGQGGERDGGPGGITITSEMIERSKATNALEALERARTHLTVQETRGGNPVRIYHRGIDSLVNDPQVLVVIDGTPVSAPIDRLRSIPAETIAYIQLLTGREATPRYGTLAGNGVIFVRTQATVANR